MLNWLRRRNRRTDPLAQGRSRLGESKLCDVCNADLDPARGYALSTRQVVTSVGFWEQTLKAGKAVGAAFDVEGLELATFEASLQLKSEDTTAWLVCENCSEYFVFDRDAARSHALAGTRPGPRKRVKIGEFALYAGIGYQRVYGSWPANIAPVSPVAECDFCGRDVYAPEPISYVNRESLRRLRAKGWLDAPINEPEDGEWRACPSCLAVVAARQARAESG